MYTTEKCCYTTYYTENVNKVFNQDLNAEATNVMPVMDMFWGERYGQPRDPFRHVWSIATHEQTLARKKYRKR